jgi:hypothetical protein
MYLKDKTLKKRYSIFPIIHNDLWEMYKKAEAKTWVAEEPDLSKDRFDELKEEEKIYLKNILAFFAISDGLVIDNLATNFLNEVEILEAQYFYQFQGKYYTYVNQIFYLLKDQTGFQSLINNPNGPFSVIPISSNLNCSTTFTLKTTPNPNRIEYSYIDGTDMSNHFVSYIDIPACPLDSSGTNLFPLCQSAYNEFPPKWDYGKYTQRNFLETIRYQLTDDITLQLEKIHYPYYQVPFSGNLFDFTINGSNVTLSTKHKISITLLLSSNPVMCYNFNTAHLAQKDVTNFIRST